MPAIPVLRRLRQEDVQFKPDLQSKNLKKKKKSHSSLRM
jgi:hypothetical protein